MLDPKKNRTQPDLILIEQFRRKGYSCKEIIEREATILILTHEKKHAVKHEFSYTGMRFKNFFRAN